MKTAVAAPADDGRERFLWALQALLQKRVSGEALMFGVYTRYMADERDRKRKKEG